jgi:hypothetical protein
MVNNWPEWTQARNRCRDSRLIAGSYLHSR